MISAQDTGQICVLSGHYRDQQEVVVEREGKRFPLKTMQPQMLHSGDKVSITTFNGYNSETAE
jgi:hypothetical protein